MSPRVDKVMECEPSSMTQKRATHAHSNHTWVVTLLIHNNSTKILVFYESIKTRAGARDAQGKNCEKRKCTQEDEIDINLC